MATFGYLTLGASPVSAANLCFANIRSSELHTAASGDTITKIYIGGSVTGSARTTQAAPYTMSGGQPNTRVGTGDGISIGNTAQFWESGTLSIALTAGVTYTIGFESNAGGSSFVMRFDSFAGNNRARHASATLPATWTSTTNSGAVFSVYADYSTGGGYTLALDPGSFALTGQDAGMSADRKLTAEQGSIALTGVDVSALINRYLSMGQGSFSLSGQDVSTIASRLMGAAAGMFSLSGQTVALTLRMTAGPGVINITGQDAGLILSRLIALSHGSFTATGHDALLPVSRRLVAGQGDIALTGNDVTLTGSASEYSLSCDTGTYGIIGQDATILLGRAVALNAGEFALSGQAASLVRTIALALDGGEFVFTGQGLGFTTARVMIPGQGSFALTGYAVLFSTGETGSKASSRLMVAFIAQPMQVSIPGPQVIYLPASIEVEI